MLMNFILEQNLEETKDEVIWIFGEKVFQAEGSTDTKRFRRRNKPAC